MTDIINAIDSWIDSQFAALNRKTWGFCELVTRTNQSSSQVMPMTITGSHERKQVSLDDKKDFITWIRLVQPVNYQASSDWSFGRKEAREANLALRIVVAHKVELGENLIFEFAQYFPENFNIPGYKYVFTGTPTIDPDHETIYRTELGETVYERHRFPWNIFTVTFNVQFIVCDTGECCADSYTTEDEVCLVTE